MILRRHYHFRYIIDVIDYGHFFLWLLLFFRYYFAFAFDISFAIIDYCIYYYDYCWWHLACIHYADISDDWYYIDRLLMMIFITPRHSLLSYFLSLFSLRYCWYCRLRCDADIRHAMPATSLLLRYYRYIAILHYCCHAADTILLILRHYADYAILLLILAVAMICRWYHSYDIIMPEAYYW